MAFFQPGLVELLLNRNAPGCQIKEVMELKLAIMEAAGGHPDAANVFQPGTMSKINQYVNQGVYFTQSEQMQVATDV